MPAIDEGNGPYINAFCGRQHRAAQGNGPAKHQTLGRFEALSLDVATTHNSSDFDAVASLVAAGILYGEAQLVLPTRINPNVRAFLSIHKDLFSFDSPKDVVPAEVTRLVVVDTNQWSRLERLRCLKNRPELCIHVYDHHNAISDMNTAIAREESIGACTTMLVEDVQGRSLSISPMQATLFLAGIYEDTGNMTFPSTTPRDARAAAYLLENGADLNVLEKFLRPSYGLDHKDLLHEMMEKAERIKVNGHRVSICKMELTHHVQGLSMIVHMHKNIANVDAAFGIFTDERNHRCIVIARSGVDGLDVGQMMRTMGGGGHPTAASALLKDVHPDGVREWILELIQDSRRTVVQIGDMMSFPLVSIPPDTSMREAKDFLDQKGFSGLPVMEGDKLLGVLSRRDIDKVRKKSQWKAPVKAFMARDVFTAGPDMGVLEAARLMVKHDIGRIPVVEDERVIGIFTRSDAMLYYYDLLPE